MTPPSPSVTVRVPATSANLGPGFDALGIALDITGSVTLTVSDQPAALPTAGAEKLAREAAAGVFTAVGRPVPDGLTASYVGDIPVGRGMGASAVVRVGGVVAANELLGRPLTADQLLRIAAEQEGHADNVAPALCGGFQVCVWAADGIHRVQVPLPPALQMVVLVPDFEMSTDESRKLLPVSLTRAEAVHNIGRAALLVGALATGNLAALDVATQDILHQPARAKLFPAMFDIFAAAKQAGAVCAYLSGGGSSIMAFTTDRMDAIGAAMLATLRAAGHDGRVIVTRPSAQGARVV